ncbi:MAG: hypothetical protein ACYDCL_18030 [Myxococcales bacterium]
MRIRVLLFCALSVGLACCSNTPPPGSGDGGADGGTGGTSGGSGGAGCDAGPGLGASCRPGSPDACAPCGYVCAGSGGPGSCQLPTVGEPCQPGTGCASGDICALVQQAPPAYDCFQGCTTSADCTLTSSSCQSYGTQTLCNANLCGPAVPVTDSSSGPAYFAGCDATPDAGGGYCLPEASSIGNVGFCFAGGSAGATGCSLNRGDGGALCPPGSFCLPDAQTGQSACLPICATASGAGPACATGSTCLPFASGSAMGAFGVCLTACASQASCGAGLGCQPVAELPDAGTFCIP